MIRPELRLRGFSAAGRRGKEHCLAIDADILKTEAIPAYIKAVPYGQEVETVARNAGIVMDTGKVAAVSLFCFDFDRYDQGGEQTYASGAAILGECLSRWQYCGR